MECGEEGRLIKLGIPQVPIAQVPPFEIQMMPTRQALVTQKQRYD